MNGFWAMGIDSAICYLGQGRCYRTPLLLCCLILVNGCESLSTAKTVDPKVSKSPYAAPSTRLESEVQVLLREAQIAFLDHRLTTPVDNNAWYRYLRVLTLDPGNQRAVQGISDLVEKYLEWALEDLDTGNIRKARNNIARARAIDDTHPNLPAVERRLAEKLGNSEELVKLQVSELDSRSPLLERRLVELGGHIQMHNAMVVIVARSDEEGRWIYQQLNRADPENRIRAQIRIESQPYLRIAGSP